jgi:hypothetical protein
MLQNMHLLMALPSDGGQIVFAAKQAEHLPVLGLRLYLPSGHVNRLDKIAFWLKRLNSDPIAWLQPSEARWRVDLQGAKTFFEKEVAKSYPYRSEVSWPSWLVGTVSLAPEFESGPDFKPRLVFYFTELVLAKSSNPLASEAAQAVVVNQIIYGGYNVSSDQFNISNVSGQIGAIGTNNTAAGATFSQSVTNFENSIDLAALAHELATLKTELKKVATEVEHEFSVANVAAAESAAKKGDAEGSFKYLKAAGKWALDTATKIGTEVAIKAIDAAIKAP